MPELLRAENLVRRHGERTILAVTTLGIAAGEIVAVLGPNGAGKSTLFRVLLLLERPDEGSICFAGERVDGRAHAVRRRMAGVFQRPHLFAGTVEQNVAFTLQARGTPRAARGPAVAAALATLGLQAIAQRRVETLSGGEAQRVALARAIVARPDLLLLDEPTANLDAAMKRRFRDELQSVMRAGATSSLVITHDPADAFALADRIIVLEHGRVVQSGAPADLMTRPATAFVAEFAGAELLLDGTITARDEDVAAVDIGAGVRLWAVIPHDTGAVLPGARVHVAYRPDDVVLAAHGTSDVSSERNRLDLRVAAVTPAGSLVRVRLTGAVQLVALVTRASAAALGLAPGTPIQARLKATALRVFPAP